MRNFFPESNEPTRADQAARVDRAAQTGQAVQADRAAQVGQATQADQASQVGQAAQADRATQAGQATRVGQATQADQATRENHPMQMSEFLRGWAASLLHAPARVATVAGATFTQLVRMRLFLVLAVFALGFLALQFVPYQDQLGIEFRGVQQLQLIKDVALGCMQLFGLIFCVAATALLLPRDTEDRILYTILCKPVPRFDYLAGKALGVLALLAGMLLFMDGLMSLLLWLREASLAEELRAALEAQGYTAAEAQPYLAQVHEAGNTWDTQRGIVAMFLGFAVLTTLTLLFSCFTSGTIVSMIFALGAYFIGMFQGQFFHALSAGSGHIGMGELMQRAGQVCAVLLPDFGLFTVSDTASAGAVLRGELLGQLALIALAYMLLHLLIATWIFARKEF